MAAVAPQHSLYTELLCRLHELARFVPGGGKEQQETWMSTRGRYHRATSNLKRSNLLLRRLCSTVPGLVQIRHRSAPWGHDGLRDRRYRQASSLMRRGPQARKNLRSTG